MLDLIKNTHPEWQPIIKHALAQMDQKYLLKLQQTHDWLPGQSALFAAFGLPLSITKYILLGESPYPRIQSANGFAFWDNAVNSLWSSTGLSKAVNRATSLRNLIKMLLYCRGDLTADFSQPAISKLNKALYVQTAAQLFQSFISNGFLLLNATLVYSDGKVPYHAKQWRPFMHELLMQLANQYPYIKLLALGNIANQIPEIKFFEVITAEHPYNLSFITNPNVIEFFKPLNLLSAHE